MSIYLEIIERIFNPNNTELGLNIDVYSILNIFITCSNEDVFILHKMMPLAL